MPEQQTAPQCPSHPIAMLRHEAGFSRNKTNPDGTPKRFGPSWRCQVQGCKQILWIPEPGDGYTRPEQVHASSTPTSAALPSPTQAPISSHVSIAQTAINAAAAYGGRTAMNEMDMKALAKDFHRALVRVSRGEELIFEHHDDLPS